MLRSKVSNYLKLGRSLTKSPYKQRFFCKNSGDKDMQLDKQDADTKQPKKFDDRDIIGEDPSIIVQPDKFVSVKEELEKLRMDAYDLSKSHGDKLKKGGIIVDVQPRDKEGNIKYDRDVQLKMDHYKILKQNEVYNEKELQRAKGVLDFTELTQLEKKALNVEKLLENGFQLAGVQYPGAIIAFPNQVFLWDVYNCYDIRTHMFDILDVIKPPAKYVLIGTGGTDNILDDTILYHQRDKYNIKVDVCNTFQAISTYNVQQEDELSVVLFAIPENR